MAKPKYPAVAEAIRAGGGATKLAEQMRGMVAKPPHRSRIQHWVHDNVPPRYVLALEALSGISRHRLRPDIYPPGSSPPPQQNGARA